MFTWWTMPVPGGTTLKSSNAVWPQRRNWYRSPLRSYSISTLRSSAFSVPNRSAMTEWSMTSLGRRERVDLRRVAAEVGDRLAHRGEVDDAGHAGEVLHHDAGGRELDLGVGLGRGIPRSERLDLRLRDVRAVLGAEQVLEQHLEAERELLVARDRCRCGRSRSRCCRPSGCSWHRSCQPWTRAVSFVGGGSGPRPGTPHLPPQRSPRLVRLA